MQEIDDFFDQLDPNIDVIWGTATDDTLGGDAKVTILATGMEDSLKEEVNTDVYRNDDEYFESLIPLLYKPRKKTVAEVILEMMDEYTASYYIISSHTQKHIAGSNRIWYERLKVVTLPRELVVREE